MVRTQSLQPAEWAQVDLTFEAFYAAEYSRLARALLLLTGDPAEAEDLAQEAMSRVFERWDRVRRMESPIGYVFRTARNVHRKRVRRRAIRVRRQPPVANRDALQQVEDRSDVVRALAALPEGQREALILVEWFELESEEAGRLLGIQAASVRSRVHRARGALRERLEEARE